MELLGIHAPMACTVVEVMVAEGDAVRAGQTLLVVEAMKMEHEIRADADACVAELQVRVGDLVSENDLMVRLAPSAAASAAPAIAADPSRVGAAAAMSPAPTESTAAAASASASASASAVAVAVSAESTRPVAGNWSTEHPDSALRADLRAVKERHAFTLDAHRPEAVARRHAGGQRTARENIALLCDDGSFIEYGALAIAAQRSRRPLDDLVRNTPADGMVTGIGSVNCRLGWSNKDAAADRRCVVMAYDATVLAGTQGMRNHQKTDRMLGIALQQRLPVVLFAEGGGGRPGDTDMPIVAGLHVATFASYARLSGQVPVVGVVSGRCFAGNAALLGCSDVIIATRNSNIGMAGPAMVEGGGLGVFKPEQIGPSDVQAGNGVIDVLVDDDDEAIDVARQYLSYFQGCVEAWSAADPQLLRDVLPAHRARVYDMRQVMRLVADTESLLELRAGFGLGILTALARIEGRPVGLLASNPAHLGGAIDANAADKAARFMQLCNVHGLPLVSLVDTPGFMVGPDVEAQAQVRHVSRMFVVAAHLRVPLLSIVLRKGYGLGAMAMAGGGFHAPLLTAAWPSGEFGAMGLEGAVRLGYRKELGAVPQGPERDALFQRLLEQQIANGSAINMASTLEIDAVIDPAETRAWLSRSLATSRVELSDAQDSGGRFVDPW